MRDLGNDRSLMVENPGHRSRFARMGIRIVHADGVYPVKSVFVRERCSLDELSTIAYKSSPSRLQAPANIPRRAK